MSKLIDLAQQHVRESEARLRHIDELMARALQTPAKLGVVTDADIGAKQLSTIRDRLPLTPDGGKLPPRFERSGVARRREDPKSALETIGIELEKALAAVLKVAH